MSAAALHTAAGLWRDYLWPHARAAFGAAGVREQRRHADKVLRWLAAHPVHEVSREQIRREVLSQAVDADGADAIIALLVAQGWLQPVARATGGPGRPPRRWQVNATLLSEDVPAISATDEDPFSPRRRGEGARRADEGLRGLDTVSDGDDVSNTSTDRSAAEPLIRRCAPPSPRLRGEKGMVPAISATDSETKTYRHPERSEGSPAKDARYAMLREIPLLNLSKGARDDGGARRVPAISATAGERPPRTNESSAV